MGSVRVKEEPHLAHGREKHWHKLRATVLSEQPTIFFIIIIIILECGLVRKYALTTFSSVHNQHVVSQLGQ